MTKRFVSTTMLAVVLALMLSACEGGLTLSGVSENSRLSPQGGWIEITARKINGSSVRDLELGWGGVRVETAVAVEVGSGSLSIELLDEEDNVTLSVAATPGNPASGTGYVDTDWDGEANYRMTAEEAQDVTLRFDFQVE